ncbi:MAG TPA: hypothetical protein VJQ26_14110 [Ktedonobacteraceae bacterium]|nr:hypothetical protein [Ktedonobacteraceae bacterium]
MIVLHAIWDHLVSAKLHIWAESSSLPMTISRGVGRQNEEQEPRQHPFALAYDPLKEALGELAGSLLVESAGSAMLTLHMPSTPKGPMHSPELIVEETGELRGTAFKP